MTSQLYHHYITIKTYQNDPGKCLNPSAPFCADRRGFFTTTLDQDHSQTLPITAIHEHDCLFFPARFTQLRKWPKIWGMIWNNGGLIIKHDDLMEFNGISWGYPVEYPKLWPVELEKLGIAAPNLWPVRMGGWHSMELWVPDVQTKLWWMEIVALGTQQNPTSHEWEKSQLSPNRKWSPGMPIKQVQSIYSPNQPSACNDVGTKLIQVSHSKEVSSISFYVLICTIVSPHYKSSHLWLFHNDPI